MEIFLRYLQQKGTGYRWRLPHPPENLLCDPRGPNPTYLDGNTLLIPGSAFCDDLILMCTSHAEAQERLCDLEKFLASCGMSLSPTKCHYSSYDPTINTDVTQPPLRTTMTATLAESQAATNKGTIETEAPYFRILPWQPPETPFKYLG
jgi:hypothetical protein